MIDKETINELKDCRFEEHVKDTLKAFNEENVTYYVILSNKEPSMNKADQVGFFNFPCLFQGLYKRNKEIWILYSTGNLIFPSKEILAKTKALVVPGSHLNVNDNYAFLRQTEEWLRNFHIEYPDIKYLGICFGHQLLCNALGGSVDSMRNRKKNRMGFVCNPEKIELKDKFWEFDFVKKSNVRKKKELYLYQSHGDEVVKVPKVFECLGSSKSCEVEMLVSDDNRYFCVQGHPEYDVDFTTARSCNYAYNGIYSYDEMEDIFEERAEEKRKCVNNQYEWRSICYSFLKC